jgi:hypothetical protein
MENPYPRHPAWAGPCAVFPKFNVPGHLLACDAGGLYLIQDAEYGSVTFPFTPANPSAILNHDGEMAVLFHCSACYGNKTRTQLMPVSWQIEG